MQVKQGGLWSPGWQDPKVYVCITTNIGWRKDGLNPMGAGTAKQAASRFPDLPIWYGELCMQQREQTPVVWKRFSSLRGGCNLVLVPVKRLEPAAPSLSWQYLASLSLIEQSLGQLVELFPSGCDAKEVRVPKLGCGTYSGGLSFDEVGPLMERILVSDVFVRV